MSSSHFYRQRRYEAIEREIQSTLPPTRVIPAGKITSLVNRLSQAPKRLPSLHPPRPSDETIHLGPESDRSMPVYDAVRDEHLALFWARQQVLLAEHQHKRSTSPNSTLTPRSARPLATGEVLLAPVYRKPKPPPGGVAYPYGRPPNSARGAQRKKSPSPQTAAAQKRRNSANDLNRLTAASEEEETPYAPAPKVPAPPPKRATQERKQEETVASHNAQDDTYKDEASAKTSAVDRTASLQSSPQKKSSRSSHRSPSASRSRSRSNSSTRRSRSSSRSSTRRSASHNEAITPSNRRNTTMPQDTTEGKSPGTSDLPQTHDDKGSPWHMTQSIPSMELRPDPRALSPGAHLPDATPTLTPAPDNYGDDFEED